MNIAMIIFRAQPERGGAERYVNDLCIELARRGHQIRVLASEGPAGKDVEFVKLRSGGVTRVARYRRFCKSVERHVATNGYDIVHAGLPVPRCDVYQAHSGLETITLRDDHLREPTLARQSVAKLLNGLNRKRHAFVRVERALITSATPPITICPSNRECEEAKMLFPSSRDRFVALHSMPSSARFAIGDVHERRRITRRKLSLDDASTMFVFIGNDFNRKGLATAIRALGKVKDPRAMLIVVGNGDTHHYSEIALKAGAMGRVLFVGRVENVPDYLAAADAMVLPTLSEPFGMVVVESMLMGVPPIVSAVAGASEIVDHERNGFVIDRATDVDAWANAMTRMTDRAFRETLAAACQERSKRFDFADHVDSIESIYARALARKKP